MIPILQDFISTLNFISILRALDMLENIELLTPETKISPIELKKLQGKKRMRVRKNNAI